MTEEPKSREIVRELIAYTHDVETGRHLQRETWVQGTFKHDEHDIDLRLDHGVGNGHAELSLMIDIDGKRAVWEYIDMTTLVETWATLVIESELKKRSAD